ncbi:pirin family protein [Gluconobacter oxydans]|uniref:Pirin-like protein n=2 Tax=Gluconobacter oxydans TaxID=442 RepID=Q5FQH1_GLUOX|nr:pirin-like bicupin family protein [Gluconobacter oxydans]AAW61375.1 Pirin-like protein [Gluconobacter oxydans 621H]KXV34822.1 pirin [Gluconobacter oxydans]MBF0857290.1 hypothetical protein [Gluconobacter oxydans]TCW22024.1 hypothetical protein EDC20_1364 [Gluconobacter oxydans]GEC61841.1 pirin-like protein [Gluconobacter oxydans]
MLDIRPFKTLGHANHGWLDAHYHFSFSDYHDRNRMHWGRLRVWNDDRISPHNGFGAHPHRDMEIITYVRTGAITHEDSLGNRGRTEAGDVQVMSAGSGIIHSEFNRDDEATTLFQIWLIPDETGGTPSWGTRPFPRHERNGRFVPLASGFPEDKALPIRTRGRVLGATLKAGETLTYETDRSMLSYFVPATGSVEIDGRTVGHRDGAAIHDVERFTITALEDAEIVLVESAALR